MAGQPPSADRRADRQSAFATTHWSLVRAAGKVDAPEGAVALEALCRTYWYPVYAHIRRWGRNPEDARDLTQGFFLHLLESHALGKVDPSRGRFRSFLLGSLRHFLQHAHAREKAGKRGGDRTFVSWDQETAEARLGPASVDAESPDRVFDRHWAMTLLDRAFHELRGHYHASGQAALFEALKSHITPDEAPGTLADTAEALGTTVAAVKSAAFRLRRRYHMMIRDQVAQTVDNPGELEDELRHLLAVFSKPQ